MSTDKIDEEQELFIKSEAPYSVKFIKYRKYVIMALNSLNILLAMNLYDESLIWFKVFFLLLFFDVHNNPDDAKTDKLLNY